MIKGTKVICLSGSTRFTEQMLVIQWELTKQGNVVLSWCALPDWYFKGEDKSHIGDQEGVKKIVDDLLRNLGCSPIDTVLKSTPQARRTNV